MPSISKTLCLAQILLLSLICCTLACDLIPNSDPSESCFDLKSTPHLTAADSQFGNFIEGAGVNSAGHIFAVNYGTPQTLHQLGQVSPSPQRLLYADSLQNSHFNGIRFLNSSRAFAADVVNHRVVRLDIQTQPDGSSVVVGNSNYCSDPTMLQPNDITLASTGTIFTSGMRWLSDTDNTHGDIWVCTPRNTFRRLEVMGRTNGIELSPDDNTLYVSESYNRGGTPYVQKIWKYNADTVIGSISGKVLFADFDVIDGTANVDIDGMRTDIKGNLFVTRHGGGQVVIFSPQGTVLGKIALTFPNPTNIEFGGPQGTTLFIVGACGAGGQGKGCVDRLEVVTPGRAWSALQGKVSECNESSSGRR